MQVSRRRKPDFDDAAKKPSSVLAMSKEDCRLRPKLALPNLQVKGGQDMWQGKTGVVRKKLEYKEPNGSRREKIQTSGGTTSIIPTQPPSASALSQVP